MPTLAHWLGDLVVADSFTLLLEAFRMEEKNIQIYNCHPEGPIHKQGGPAQWRGSHGDIS